MIKLCGIRRAEDVQYVNEFPPDYIGMILAEGFRRTIGVEAAAEITKSLDGRIKKTGVFVDTPIATVERAVEKIGLDAIQLHGHEDGGYIEKLRRLNIPIWKAVRVKTEEDIAKADALGCDHLLLDSFVQGTVGGTGVTADWNMIKNTLIKTPFFLAGGINEDNLSAALKVSENIDISGGIETDGVKDREKIRRVMDIYQRNAEVTRGKTGR